MFEELYRKLQLQAKAMKATLEKPTTEKQLRMRDLKPGDIAEIIEPDHFCTGAIIAVGYSRSCAVELGGEGSTWTAPSESNLRVRRLTPGEKIVIS